MSGGSMGYVFGRISEEAHMLEDPEMVELAKDMAMIFHDAEWYHSGDIRREIYIDSVKAFKKKWFGNERQERLKRYVDELFGTAMEQCLEMIEGGSKNGEA